MKGSVEKVLKYSITTLFFLFLLLPLWNDFLRVLPEGAPHGMRPAKQLPPFSVETFLHRGWQKAAEEVSKKRSGLWSPLVKLQNELLSTFFSQISAFPNGSVLVGNDNYLFQPAHLSSLNRRNRFDEQRVRTQLLNLKKLQDLLLARGKSLVVLITPNLIHLYPDLVPSSFIDPLSATRESGYKRVVSLMSELGIQYVDTYKLLDEQRATYPFRFFARSGSHWNDVGSCLALAAVNEKLQEMGGKRLRKFSCEKWHFEDPPRNKDQDLVAVANVLFPERFFDPVPYVDVEFTEPELSMRPTVQLVGTSYLFALLGHLSSWNLASESIFYFYYRQWKRGGDRRLYDLVKEKLDWEKVLDRDIIILNIGMSTPTDIGYGFVEDALQHLSSPELSTHSTRKKLFAFAH